MTQVGVAACPKCGARYGVQESAAGQTLPCPACGTKFVVQPVARAADDFLPPSVDLAAGGPAFAALRIKHYKNFLRLKFERDRLTIYPLGIDKVPGPDHWREAPKGRDNPLPHNPKLIAVKPIDVRLIEPPIVIDRADEKAE